MCGIVGYADFGNKSRTRPDTLLKMAGTLIHRGPDGDGAGAGGDRGQERERLRQVAVGEEVVLGRLVQHHADLPAHARGEPVGTHDELRRSFVLRTGVRGQGVLQFAQQLLERFGGFPGLLQANVQTLKGIKAVGM